MSRDAARTAEHDQRAAELRDLVQLVHEHRRSGVCDPWCPGIRTVLALPASTARCMNLLIAALVRIDDLQTGIGDAIASGSPDVSPLDHPWHP